MHKFSAGFLILMAGWGLGWYAHTHWSADPIQSAQPDISAPSKPVNADESAADFTPAAPGHVDDIVSLLQRNEFEAAVERYESMQIQENRTARGVLLWGLRQCCLAASEQTPGSSI